MQKPSPQRCCDTSSPALALPSPAQHPLLLVFVPSSFLALIVLTGTPCLQADYSRVIALDPTNAHAYHNRGISHDKSGAYESAVADFSKVRSTPSAAVTVSGPQPASCISLLCLFVPCPC